MAELYDLVQRLVRDEAARFQHPDYDSAVALAVERYGQDRPRRVVEDVPADGSSALPLPTAWEAWRTRIAGLEYPSGEFPVSWIDPQYYGVVDTPAGEEIRLVGALQAGETVRAHLDLPHGADSVPEHDREAVALLAAAGLLDQLATWLADTQDSLIQADAVERRTKSQEYAGRARAYRTRYHELLGIDPKRLVAASATVNLDLADSRGRDRLTHPARHR